MSAADATRTRVEQLRRLLFTTAVAVLLGACLCGTALAYATIGAPSNVTVPTIGGKTFDEAVLTAKAGKWSGSTPISYTYAWEQCDSSGVTCTAIAGATAAKFRVPHAEVGHTLRVEVTATNAEGSSSILSRLSAAIAPVKPKHLLKPAVVGSAVDGQILSAQAGTWKGTPPFALSYQWTSCLKSQCEELAGATSPSYRVLTAEIGRQLRVTVTASNSLGSATNTSKLSPKILAGPPVSLVTPTISGTPLYGQTLSASTGEWAGTGPFTFSYQWRSCPLLGGQCTIIEGATEPTYAPSLADIGSSFEAVVTATGADGSTSASSEPVTVLGAKPVNTGLPAVSGTAESGQLLSASRGEWSGTEPFVYTYQWELCSSSGEQCSDIPAAILPSMLVSDQDVGDTLRVRVTATNIAGSRSAVSEPSPAIAGVPPRNLLAPGVLGLPIVGQTLTALDGIWSGSQPIASAYQWQRCTGGSCTDISGATESTYTLTSEDAGDTLRVQVTATNTGGSATASSPATLQISGVAPSNSTAPTITGTVESGQLLTATTGTWSGTQPILYSYQWERCNTAGEECAQVFGAILPAYLLSNEDIGHTLRIKISATNITGTQTTLSPPTAVVKAVPPTNVLPPGIIGLPLVGQTLTSLNGLWFGSEPIAYTYQWQRCTNGSCTDIAGATESTYTLTSEDAGDTLRVQVTATNTGGSEASTSASTLKVTGVAASASEAPKITGTVESGQLLTATTGTWSGTQPILYGYQWERCNAAGEECTEVFAAILPAYLLSNEDIGHTIRIKVSATNITGTQTTLSAPSAVVKAVPPTNLIAPGIGGLPIVGQTVIALNGLWLGSEPIAYTYQWQDCTSSGCANIQGATGSTYMVASSDASATLRVQVTATNAGGSATASSPTSSQVAGVAPNLTAAPAVSGEAKSGQLLTASTGTWSGTQPILYSYQWERCNAAGEECTEVFAAILPAYLLSNEDIGHTLRVKVSATNITGTQTTLSAPTAVIKAVPPTNVLAPGIIGLPLVGQTLTATNGVWSGSEPMTYAYQWQQCTSSGCTNISGATESTYTLTSSSAGDTVKLVVTSTNTGGATSATAATGTVTGVAPASTAAPAVSGEAKSGQLLTAGTGSWSGTQPILYGYQWQLCNSAGEACSNIGAAILPSLQLGSGDVGHTLRIAVTASNIAGSTTVTSEPTAIVKAIPPANVLAPGIVGLPIVGQTLSASGGIWSGSEPLTYAYQWQQCNSSAGSCTNISGATGSSYTIAEGLTGSTIRLLVTVSNAGGSASATTAATGAITGAPPANTSAPTVSGEAKSGQLLTAGTGSWNGTQPILYGYQWQLCNSAGEACSNIGAAILPSLLLGNEDIGDTVRIATTASNIAGTRTAYSQPTAVVKAIPPTNTLAPGILGLMFPGQTLTAVNGLWSGSEPMTYAYQWQQCNPSGGSCANIAGATKSTYTIASAQAGETIKLLVTATNAGGAATAASLSSLVL